MQAEPSSQVALLGSALDLQVLSVAQEQGKYCREIALLRQADHAVVQFGIVRLNLGLLEEVVREQIEDLAKAVHDVLFEPKLQTPLKTLTSCRPHCPRR